MIGIITEKPSARKKFGQALGGDRGTYKGQDYLLVNLRGHLYEYVEPDKQVEKELANKYASWAISNLPWHYKDFKWKKAITPGASQLIKEIKEKLSICNEIVIATDFDAISGEGFLLGAEVLLECNLLKKGVKLSRMIFLNEDEQTLLKAFDQREEIKDIKTYVEFRKSLFRSQLDFLTQQHTRVATAFCPRKLGIPRQGRLKSYIVKEVGDAWEKIKAHKDKKFFQNRFIDENGNYYISSDELKYDTPNECNLKHFVASSITKHGETIKHTAPPKLFDFARLSAILVRLGYSIKQIKDCYQKMYEDNVLSYPRTSDATITLAQFNELLPLVDKIAKLTGVDTKYLTHKKPRPTHVKDGGSHGANRPGLNIPNSILSIEKRYGKLGVKIYNILARSFLSILAEDYIYIHEYGYVTDFPTFKGSVNIPQSLGWKNILINLYHEEDDEAPCKKLGKIGTPIIYQGEYPKPKIPTMLYLSNIMEKNDVGTGATRASTIGEISNANSKYPLLINDKGKLSLTLLGQVSYSLIKDTHIASLEFTEHLIKVMRSIGTDKEIDTLKELNQIENIILEDLATMRKNRDTSVKEYYDKKASGQLKDTAPTVEKIETKDKHGKTVQFKKEWNNHTFTADELTKLTNGEKIKIGPFQNKKGKEYFAIGYLDWQQFKGKKFYGFKVHEFIE